MKLWPVPNSFMKTLPKHPEPGSFWRFREDRYHCGVDIYAPQGSQVIAIENGIVVETGVFTSPKIISYWNETFYIIMQHDSGVYCKYAEMESVFAEVGERVFSGGEIGRVGEVLNSQQITTDAPAYIQSLQNNGNGSMLHLEMYDREPSNDEEEYLGGNAFNGKKLKNLIDPTEYFKQ